MSSVCFHVTESGYIESLYPWECADFLPKFRLVFKPRGIRRLSNQAKPAADDEWEKWLRHVAGVAAGMGARDTDDLTYFAARCYKSHLSHMLGLQFYFFEFRENIIPQPLTRYELDETIFRK